MRKNYVLEDEEEPSLFRPLPGPPHNLLVFDRKTTWPLHLNFHEQQSLCLDLYVLQLE